MYMLSSLKKAIKKLPMLTILLAILFLFASGLETASAQSDVFENYPAPDQVRILRKLAVNGDIYEYMNETIKTDGAGNEYGRLMLIYEQSDYKVLDWDDANLQVTTTTYDGVYDPGANTPPHSDVIQSERRESIVYDRNPANDSGGDNLNTSTNGWVMREKTIYATDGTTVLQKYFYDAQERLVSEIDTQANTYITYEYVNSFTSPRYKKEHTYLEAQESQVLAGNDVGVLTKTTEYVDSDFVIEWYPDGSVKTFWIDGGGNAHVNTDLEGTTGIFTKYEWDVNWNLIKAVKTYPNGTVEICTPSSPSDPSWPLVEKRVPTDDFYAGVNLPWLRYGYDIGAQQDGTHWGFSSNLPELYKGQVAVPAMNNNSKSYVRTFLFNDLRAGMHFDVNGNPTGFTAKVYEDMQALLDSAKAMGIKVMPVLFDFTLGADRNSTLGPHHDLITNPVKRQALVNIMQPFIDHFKDNDSILAWDIMNEPEMINHFGGIAKSDVFDFLKAFNVMVQATDPNKDVTIGNAHRSGLLEMLNYWAGQSYNDPLDIYQIHYYDYMENENPPLNKLDQWFTPAELALMGGGAKDIIYGEVQPSDILQKLETIRQNGYGGSLFWQDDSGNFTISEQDYQTLLNYFVGITYKYYQPSGYLMTKEEADGTLYEYSDEDWNGQGCTSP